MSRRVVIALLTLAAACATGEGGEGTRDAGLEIIDAAVDQPDAPPGCQDMTIDLLANGDFEAGQTDWVETTNGALGLIREEGAGLPFDAEAGAWAAIIGGFNNASITMTQTVSIPADATPSRFAGSGCFVTEEMMGTMFDFMTLDIRAGGTPVETVLDISNADADATCDWTPFEVDLTMVAAGSDVEVQLAATTDGASVTTFAFDSLVLEATRCD